MILPGTNYLSGHELRVEITGINLKRGWVDYHFTKRNGYLIDTSIATTLRIRYVTRSSGKRNTADSVPCSCNNPLCAERDSVAQINALTNNYRRRTIFDRGLKRQYFYSVELVVVLETPTFCFILVSKNIERVTELYVFTSQNLRYSILSFVYRFFLFSLLSLFY